MDIAAAIAPVVASAAFVVQDLLDMSDFESSDSDNDDSDEVDFEMAEVVLNDLKETVMEDDIELCIHGDYRPNIQRQLRKEAVAEMLRYYSQFDV
jgi:hypothetical protein